LARIAVSKDRRRKAWNEPGMYEVPRKTGHAFQAAAAEQDFAEQEVSGAWRFGRRQNACEGQESVAACATAGR
jgi:hypothetical protein